jgi:adenosylmethionine-8-amino-7-oxononanoate aminotransferase
MVDEPWELSDYPLWHGMAPMSTIVTMGSPSKLLVRGDGCWVEDAAGRRYLDARAGICNVNLGYGRRDIAEAIYRQALDMPFGCIIRFERPAPVTIEYARALVEAAPTELTRVRLTHMGSASTENALLMTRLYFKNLGQPQRWWVLALQNSFHGTTLMTMTASGEPELHDPFRPVPEGFAYAPAPYVPSDCGEEDRERIVREALEGLQHLLDKLGEDRVAAVIVEPVMGGDAVPLPQPYLQGLRELCDRSGMLLIFDEIVTGFGRVDGLFAAEGLGVVPDIMCLAKGLTSGYVPLGAVLVREHVFQAFDGKGRKFFPNGSSTDGHPVCCAGALAALHAYQHEDVIANGATQGRWMMAWLRDALRDNPIVREVRGAGLYIGIEITTLDGGAPDLMLMRHIKNAGERAGVLVQYSGSVIILMPPLIISEAEARRVVETVATVLEGVTQWLRTPSKV